MARKLENLQNKTFGYLTVESYAGFDKAKNSIWNCKCKCGNLCIVKNHNLKRGSTNSCGCLRKEMTSKDLMGQTFGYLKVVEKSGYKISKSKIGIKGQPRKPDRCIIWKCLCRCGNIHLVSTKLLTSGKTKSCGCLKTEKYKNIENLAGRVFGELNVISFHDRINNRTFWLCKCNCGKEKLIDAHHLKSGQQKSCGCRMGGWKHGLVKNKKAYYQYLMNDPVRKLRLFTGNIVRKRIKSVSGTKKGATWKHLPYTPQQLKTHLESLWEPWMNWSNYGGKPNDSRKTWWIDHIKPQSLFPYKSLDDPLFVECWALNNIRPLEKIANISKGNRSVRKIKGK